VPPTELNLGQPHAPDHPDLGHILVNMHEDRDNPIFITKDFRPRLQCGLAFANIHGFGCGKQAVRKWEACVVIFAENCVEFKVL
jgi:hypothetical protein